MLSAATEWTNWVTLCIEAHIHQSVTQWHLLFEIWGRRGSQWVCWLDCGLQRLQHFNIIVTKDKAVSYSRSVFLDILMSKSCCLIVFMYYNQSAGSWGHTMHAHPKCAVNCNTMVKLLEWRLFKGFYSLVLSKRSCPKLYLLYLLCFSGLTIRAWKLVTENSDSWYCSDVREGGALFCVLAVQSFRPFSLNNTLASTHLWSGFSLKMPHLARPLQETNDQITFVSVADLPQGTDFQCLRCSG